MGGVNRIVERTAADGTGPEIVLISISGRDRPGLTAALTGVMARYGVNVLDIGQAVIHDNLAWGMLVDVPPAAATGSLFRDLLFQAHELELNIQCTPIEPADYREWVAGRGQSRHIVTLLGRPVEAAHLARVSEVVAGNRLNIERIARLSQRASIDRPEPRRRSAIELTVRGEVPDLTAMHGQLLRVSQEMEIDIAVQEDNVFRRNRRLVCLDMDSTLIQVEVMDELAKAAGVGAEVSRITEAAMRGEIEFAESFRRRLRLLGGLDVSALETVARGLPLTEGAERLVSILKRLGFKVAIISGGFSYFANDLQRRLGLDYVHAHELEVIDGKLSGNVMGEIIDGDRKAGLLREIAAREGLNLEQVIAVGDGANDLAMLSIAGLGIAFRAKPLVNQRARHAIATSGLDGILYLLGMRDRDIAEAGGEGARGDGPAGARPRPPARDAGGGAG